MTRRDINFAFHILLLGCALLCFNSDSMMHTKQNYRSVDLGPSHVFKAPYRVIKPDNGQFWYFFKDHILVKKGAEEHIISLNDLVKKSAYRSVRLEILPLDAGMLLSRQQSLFFIPYADLSIRQLSLNLEANDFIFGLNQTDDGTLWLTTLKALYYTEDIDKGFSPIELPEAVSRPNKRRHLVLSAANFGVNSIVLSTVHSGLISVERIGQSQFKANLLPFKAYAGRDSLYRTLLVGDQLFISARQGLYRININNGAQDKLEINQPLTNLRDLVWYQNHIWFVANEQLYRTNVQLNQFEKIANQADIGFDLSTYKIRSIYADDEDNLWLSVIDKGFFVYSPSHNKFNQINARFWAIDSSEKLRRIITSDPDHPIYIFGNRTIIPSYNITLQEQVLSFYAIDNKRFWYGAKNKLALVESGKEVVSTTVEQREVTSIVANEESVWYTRSVGTIYHFDIATQTHKSLSHTAVGQLLIAPAKNAQLLSINADNIALVDVDNKAQEQVIYNSDHQAIQIQVDGQWVTLFYDNGQVAIFNRQTYDYQLLDFATNSTTCAVKQSDSDTWWLAQDNGVLIRYSLKDKSYKRFSDHDGLPLGGANGRFCGEFNDKLLFSTANGIYTTTEHLEYQNQLTPKMSLTFQTSNQAPVQINGKQSIKLKQDSFPMVIHAANSSWQNPRHNQVQYKIKGLNTNWQNLPNGSDSKEIDYLPEGKYQLQARVSNNHGLWSDSPTLNLVVLPPWWLSSAAKVIYLLAFLTLVTGLFLYRTRAIRARAQKLEKTVQQKTEQIRTEKQTVERLLASKEQEFINISHELRTPLTLMTGPLKAVSGKSQNAEVEKALNMACRNGERLHRMVDQLLHLERIELENELHKTVKNVTQVLALITESYEVYAARKAITLKLSTPENCFMQLVPDALDKIYINLLSNAIKYSNHDGEIIIKATFDKTQGLALSVKDQGIGIKDDALPQVFDKFYRVEDKQSENESGAGIGLALVKSLVQSHQGSININSIYGLGTEVIVILPASLAVNETVKSIVNQDLLSQELATLQVMPDADASEESDHDDNEKLKLLIIEDTADMREYISDSLSHQYQCHSAANGQIGLHQAQEIMPDLIICDVMMPVMDGFELTQNIKQNPLTCHIPVILLTARGDKDSRLTGFRALADDYIAKPFDAQELLIRADNLVSLRKLLRQRHAEVVRSGESLTEENDSQLNEKDAAFVDKVTDIINKQLDDEEFSTEQLSAKVFMSERQLQRKLKALIDYTPREYLQHLRLIAAQTLLLNGERVTDVSLKTGFSSSSYFTRCFKAKYNMTPKQFATKGN